MYDKALSIVKYWSHFRKLFNQTSNHNLLSVALALLYGLCLVYAPYI
jgi:hypothetical protein